ncbi:MAG: pyridoxine 5'-phosphate synthase [Candidatus Eisenbacteria bacterium]|nr:pyridoxine 5'-phosphate synthase [Candidatus Eisenbacteria bacterium]
MRLSVNVDHVATVRQARRADEPDPVWAAVAAELAGACGITVHLRGDRRHIQDRDVEALRKTVAGCLNLEMAATDEMLGIATRLRPDMCTLVPEGAGEVTTQGGLDIMAEEAAVRSAVERLKASGIGVSIFIDPDVVQVGRANAVGADIVEVHTGLYADAKGADAVTREFEKVRVAAIAACEMGLRAHGGHGLTYRNVHRIAAIGEIDEVSIGHSIVARAVVVGMDRAVREMLALLGRGAQGVRG